VSFALGAGEYQESPMNDALTLRTRKAVGSTAAGQ
jgi:hypothetical protein